MKQSEWHPWLIWRCCNWLSGWRIFNLQDGLAFYTRQANERKILAPPPAALKQ